MSHRYAPLVNPQHSPRRSNNPEADAELHAAFDDSDDEDDIHNASESHPLNPTPPSPVRTSAPGTYNFENVDYDYPPPGSPPPPSATALPNSIGNSNGLIPTLDPSFRPRPQRKWYQRAAAAVLPSSVVSSLGLAPRVPSGPVGGGTNNDGVFANVMAKPSAPVTIRDGDDIYVVPEDARAEAPPSYASAQLDAVPPYWETTVHAPFAPDSMGELLIDSLPTGSLFSFCWNFLVSVSFQFVGFLLTYLLHTSHAARLGSRAGLGITLIQYGFAIRQREAESTGSGGGWAGWNSDGSVDGTSASTGVEHHHHHRNTTVSWSTPVANMTEEQANELIASATTEWLSFFLMTIGWFVFLTSILGFWRVKQWERGVLASRGESSTPSAAPTGGSIVSRMESSFGLRGTSRMDLLRQGFGFGNRTQSQPEERDPVVPPTRSAAPTDDGHADESRETDLMIPPNSSDPERARQVLAYEQRLQQALREAGFI